MVPWRGRGRRSVLTLCPWGLEAAFPSSRFPRTFQSSCVFQPPRRGWIPRRAGRFPSLPRLACRRPCNVFPWIPWVASFSSKSDHCNNIPRARLRDTKMQNKEGTFAVSTLGGAALGGAAEFVGHREAQMPKSRKGASHAGRPCVRKGADGALVAPLDFKSSGRL